MWERVWRLKLLWKIKCILWKDSREAIPRNKPRAEHMTGMRRVMTVGVFASNSRVRPSRKIPAKHFVLLFCHLCSTMSSPILYIYHHYPHIVKSDFQRENPRNYPWDLEIVIPTIIYTIFCGFPLLLPLHIQILERLIAQTLTTLNLSVKWGFGAIGKHIIELNCVIRKS